MNFDKQLKRQISDSRLLESFFAYSSDTIITVNIEGNILFANRTSYANRHDLKEGENLFDHENDVNSTKLNGFVKEVFDTKKTKTFFFTSEDSDGEEMIYSGAINPILEKNDVIAATIVARDMTTTIQSKRDLESFEKRLKSALKSSKIIVWEWSVSKQKLIVEGEYQNVYEQKLSDYNSLEDFFEKVHSEDIDTLKFFLNNALDRGEAFEMDYRLQIAEDKFKFLHIDVEVFRNKSGRISKLIGTINDLSSQKQSEIDVLNAIVSTQEEERNRLGREIHDNIGQMLTATKLQLNTGIVKMKNGDRTASSKLELAQQILTDTIDQTRSFSHQLSPSYLSRGLSFALQELTRNLSSDEYETLLDIEHFEQHDIPDLVELNLFRIGQEILNNSIKHAKASKIWVSLSLEDGLLSLVIRDNGVGFDPQEDFVGIGLQNIENRVTLIEGDFSLESSSKGTIASVTCTPNLFAQR